MSGLPPTTAVEWLPPWQPSRRQHLLAWALFFTASALVVVACLALWVAMLAPYQMSPEMRREYGQAEVVSAQSKGVVWINTNSGIYHRPGSRWYGRTAEGRYSQEWVARAEGNRAAKNGQ